jgi:cysteinyl-tRNA synthetase
MVVNATPLEEDKPSDEVVALAEKRKTARNDKHWDESDELRDEIAALGWTVQDSKEGYTLIRS